MAVAVYIKSESGDSYLYSFEDSQSLDSIHSKLSENLDYFSPIADWTIAVSENSEYEESDVEETIREIYSLSWLGDDFND
ncbi:Hypothetical protein KNT65_gp140 [Escherichia phage EcS1]|uniref:Uncharacterized protein n=1 Tax=Escherichia phage EcS1 TaxID=2083276 RepID=A0A2Z5ZC36_9CAUD|nr:Hypothetical protein KNT65_gp140 [Escherichia phage EcS1]BBC78188.1 Hypothetical protein [Escherichia phage EcS1]